MSLPEKVLIKHCCFLNYFVDLNIDRFWDYKICSLMYCKAVNKRRRHEITKNLPPPSLVRMGIPKISKNPKSFLPKSADNVRIWRTPLSANCPHWTNPIHSDCKRLLWTAPKLIVFCCDFANIKPRT